MFNLEEYLRPNPYLRPPQPCPEFWVPPGPSRGLRQVPLRSAGSSHGHIVLEDCVLDFESRLERNVALAFLARPDTRHIVEQTPRVQYVNDDGEVQEHVFDLMVTRKDDVKVAVFVKPFDLLRPWMHRMLERIKEQLSPSVAQKLLVVTEKKLSRADVYNAELIQEVGRQPFPEDDARIAELIAGMTRPAAIADLVEPSGLHGSGFRSAVRAIAAGTITLTKPVMITPAAVVTRTAG